jgi:type I restriction enzyme S subunit
MIGGGGLPSGWGKVRFGDVVRQVKDKVDPDAAGIDRYVAGEHMDTDELRIRRWGEVGDGYLGPAFHMRFRPGHVLYGSRRTYLRKVAVADFEGICANTTFVLEPSSPELLPEFLPYVMTAESFHEHSIRQSKGSVNPYINFTDVTWYEFALPPVDEQKRIAELLDAAEDLRMKYRNLEQAATDCWLALATELLSGRESVALSEVVEVELGKKRDPKLLVEGMPIPYLRAANVKFGRFDLDDVLEMNFTAEEVERFRLKSGDVMVTEGCGSLSEVGACAIWQAEMPGEVCFQMTLLRLRARDAGLAGLLSHWAAHSFSSGAFSAVSTGTSVYHLSAARVRKMPFPVMADGERTEAVTRLDAAQSLVESARSVGAAAQRMAASLRNALLRGDGSV